VEGRDGIVRVALGGQPGGDAPAASCLTMSGQTSTSVPSPSSPPSGSSLCGGVRIEVTTPFRRANYCHCSRCRKHSGSNASAQGRVARDGFRLLARKMASPPPEVLRGTSSVRPGRECSLRTALAKRPRSPETEGAHRQGLAPTRRHSRHAPGRRALRRDRRRRPPCERTARSGPAGSG
jgi:hypothetical protein